jgi:lactam utilization protein B
MKIKADTICLHGDTPGAINLIKLVHKSLIRQRIQIVRLETMV